jgi:hypothetical protein
MNWISQVGHVAAKDVRRTRWALALYLALIAAVMASVVNGRAFGRYALSPTSHGPEIPDTLVRNLPLLIVLVGLILSAWVLQLDSPTRVNVFWANRPLSPSAVLLAKVAIVSMAIVGASLLALFTALELLDATAAVTWTMLARSAIAFGQLALAVMVVSAITDNLRTAAVSVIAIFFGAFFLPSAVRLVNVSVPMLIGMAGGAWVLVYAYRTRDKRARTRIVAVVAALSLFVASSWFSVGMERPRPTAAKGAANAGASLAIERLDATTSRGSNQLTMRLRLVSTSTTPGEQLEFRPDTVTIRAVGGREINLSFGSGFASRNFDFFPRTIRSGQLQLGPAVRWIDQSHAYGSDSFDFSFRPQTGEGAAIISPVASAAIVGTVTSLRSRVIARLPLRVGAAATHGGRRVAIYGFAHDAHGADLWVQTAAISDVNFDHPLMLYNEASTANGLHFALFNAARSEAISVNERSGNAGGGHVLVLPWIPLSTSAVYFTMESHGVPVDDAWYAGARLIVYDWEVVDRYQVRGDAAVR